jgi:hypothetical protein
LVAVGVGVSVGGTGVLVAVAVGVSVGGTGVLVAVGVGVSVGGTGVLVAVGVGVSVGGTGVFVAVGVAVTQLAVTILVEIGSLARPVWSLSAVAPLVIAWQVSLTWTEKTRVKNSPGSSVIPVQVIMSSPEIAQKPFGSGPAVPSECVSETSPIIVVPSGAASAIMTLVRTPWPLFSATIVYWIVSPGCTSIWVTTERPPSWGPLCDFTGVSAGTGVFVAVAVGGTGVGVFVGGTGVFVAVGGTGVGVFVGGIGVFVAVGGTGVGVFVGGTGVFVAVGGTGVGVFVGGTGVFVAVGGTGVLVGVGVTFGVQKRMWLMPCPVAVVRGSVSPFTGGL